MKTHTVSLLLVLTALAISSIAQSKDNCSSTVAALEGRIEGQRRMLSDWAGLNRYGSENTELPRTTPTENRVIFFGDEITELWGASPRAFFPGKTYLNRGIAGQTTAQMLVRFRQDVLLLKPKAVVIQAGTNDIASLNGPMTQAMTAENISSMVELARVNGVRVILASILPVCDCVTKQTTLRPHGKIIGINAWLKEYAAQNDVVYLDYWPLVKQSPAAPDRS